MSLLTSTAEDFAPRAGKLLPEGVYIATVESAGVEKTTNGTRLTRQYGNLRHPTSGNGEFTQADGSLFRIGNRKLFARSWIDHSNPDAARIGQQEIKREAAAAGLMKKPAAGESTGLDFDNWELYAATLTGRDVRVRAYHETRRDKEGKVLTNPDGTPIVDARVGDWLSA